MAVLFDTTVPVLLIRSGASGRRGRTHRSAGGDQGGGGKARASRSDAQDPSALIRAARNAIASGGAVLPTVALSELLIGERPTESGGGLASTVDRLPTVILPVEGARDAGVMGGFLRAVGGPVPLPDLLIAATALWLDLPLLTWDGDFARAQKLARTSKSGHEGAGLWRSVRLHPTSRDV